MSGSGYRPRYLHIRRAALYGDGLATIDEHGVDRFALMGVSDPPLSGRRSCSLSVTADEARAAHSPAAMRGCEEWTSRHGYA